METIWTNAHSASKFEKLNGNRSVAVLVIGGGLTGLLCAFFLEREGFDYIGVEADHICGGITKNSTAKITAQHGLTYQKIIKEFGTEYAKKYLEANLDALNTYKNLCKNIDCNFEIQKSYLYASRSTERLDAELKALKEIGYAATYYNHLELPVSVSGAVSFADQAQFNPAKFCAAISSYLKIHEETRVVSFDGSLVITDGGNIKANKIIVATHFPIFNKHGFYSIKMYQERSYVAAYKDFPIPNGMYLGIDADELSFRNYGNTVIIGGASARTGKRSEGWNKIEKMQKETCPTAIETQRWANQDCITPDGIPYIGQYGKKAENMYVATGFNKWSMTSSMVAAKIILDFIMERSNPYSEVFSPNRTILRPQLFKNAVESTSNLLNLQKPRCSHLGCALKWNKRERSWDCPCHGSRFSNNGALLDNPANGDLV